MNLAVSTNRPQHVDDLRVLRAQAREVDEIVEEQVVGIGLDCTAGPRGIRLEVARMHPIKLVARFMNCDGTEA